LCPAPGGDGLQPTEGPRQSPPAPGPGEARRSVIAVKAVMVIWMESLSNTDARLEIVFRNRAKTYAWRNVTVRDFGTQPRAWFPVFFSCFIPPKAQQGDSISVNVRNGKSPVYVDDLEMQWLTAVY
jgi:hypothetical protein